MGSEFGCRMVVVVGGSLAGEGKVAEVDMAAAHMVAVGRRAASGGSSSAGWGGNARARGAAAEEAVGRDPSGAVVGKAVVAAGYIAGAVKAAARDEARLRGEEGRGLSTVVVEA